MNILKALTHGKDAFQAAYLDDIYPVISDEERDKLQDAIFDIYKDILQVCKEYGFTPFLIAGSALGAIRHNNFIPWDDDLDVGMVREEYDRFLDIFEKRFPDKYCVNAPGRQERTRCRFTKIMRKGTMFREMVTLPEDELNGIFVDIFPIENTPNNRVVRAIKGLRSDILAYVASQVFHRENLTPQLITAFRRTGAANYYIRMAIGSIFGIRNASWWFAKYDKTVQWADNNSNNCTISASRKHYFGEMIKREIIWPPREVPFRDGVAPVFHDVETYLSQQYGDYMALPPVEKRERHHVMELKF